MKVFVAGASGTLGAPLVRRLVARGHEVVGLTRSAERAPRIEAAGGTPAIADALDAVALKDVVAGARPDAVVHALTALPPRGPFRPKELEATNALRTTGTSNLIDAAVAAGARRLVAESIVLAYGDTGRSTADETTALLRDPPHPALGPMVASIHGLEDRVRAATADGRIDGIILRFGVFYGHGVPSTDYQARMLKRRLLPLPGGGRSVAPWVHVEDAAEATALAVERGASGEVYNVVDDRGSSTAEFMDELAKITGAKRPLRVPLFVARLLGPLGWQMATAELRVSNAKARRDLGWVPAYPTFREGLAAR